MESLTFSISDNPSYLSQLVNAPEPIIFEKKCSRKPYGTILLIVSIVGLVVYKYYQSTNNRDGKT